MPDTLFQRLSSAGSGNEFVGIPNIFKYATKELSQDALICWLVACAKESKGELRECGLAFVQALFNSDDGRIITKEGTPERYPGKGRIAEVLCDPKPQYGKIDVYFQAKVDDNTVSFVVEDKTYTGMHGDQLKRHLGIAKRDKIDENFIKPVYFKTGHIFDDEREQAECAGYSVFGVDDMIKFLKEPQRGGGRQHRALHEFLRQYADHLERELNDRENALGAWDLNQDFVQWTFMVRLREELGMSSEAWPRKGRNRGGRAWTQLPDWEHGDFADTRFFRGNARCLFWRFDSGLPLRLIVTTYNVGEWSDETWNLWSDAFNCAREQSGLPEPSKPLRKRRRRKGQFVQEGTIGAVDVGRYLKQHGIDRCVQRLARLQEAFDELTQGE